MNSAGLFTILLTICAFAGFSQSVSEKEKELIFNKSKEVFAQHYHYKEQVKPTIDHLDRQWKSGRYQKISKLNVFTDSLAADLRHFTKDAHLNFFYDNAEIAKEQQKTPQIPWGLMHTKFLNNGLNKVEILPGDIGYIRLEAFGAIDDLLPGAFSFIQQTNALIIDLRENGGGMLSNNVASYLLPEDSIHLITIKWNNRTDSIYTVRNLKGPRYLNKPVYLLTSKSTFSSAEEFAYDLQLLKRATVVGAQTGGGANPGGIVGIHTFTDGARLGLFVPMAHVVHPISGTNWEGKGVSPDVVTEPKDALTNAHALALQAAAEKESNEFIRKRLLEIKEEINK